MANAQRKEKVTVSIDANLLKDVDTFVEQVDEPGISRSSVFEEALRLWKESAMNKLDAWYYSNQAKALSDDSWSAITAEAAKHIWNGGSTEL